MKVLGFKQIIKNKIGNFEAGVKRHGDSFIYTKFYNKNEYFGDCFVQFNIYNPYLTYNRIDKAEAYQYIINSNKPFLVCEEGAIRTLPSYKRWGWTNYKNGLGSFNNENVDNYRWKLIQEKTNIKFLDWHSPGDNILIMGQLEKDSALIEMYDLGYDSFDSYIIEQIKIIRQYTDRPIIVRPHPVGAKTFYALEEEINLKYKNISVSRNYSSTTSLNGGEGLAEDLKNSYCVITYSSNSVVEAIEKGIPVFTLSPTSSAYDIGHKDLSQIENLNYNIDISTWCNKIAYTIWDEEETSNGTMWEHLKWDQKIKLKA